MYFATLMNSFSNVDQTVVRDFTDFLLLLRQIYNQVANTFLDHAGIPFQSPFFIGNGFIFTDGNGTSK